MAKSLRRLTPLALIAAGPLLAGCAQSGPPARSSAVHSRVLPVLGRVLDDSAGYTLYVYLPDRRDRSRCTGTCAQQWPPLVLPTKIRFPTAGPGVRRSLLGTITRPGGARQVTYNGWPLYTYAQDNPGTANGQGDDMGTWYVISTAGVVNRRPVPDS